MNVKRRKMPRPRDSRSKADLYFYRGIAFLFRKCTYSLMAIAYDSLFAS
jgi:hypothetical protein